MSKLKTSKQMERHLKGMANHYRIEVLFYVAEHPNATLEQITDSIGANPKTMGEHVRRLYLAGLVYKNYRGNYVEHTLSPYGKTFVKFLESFRSVQ